MSRSFLFAYFILLSNAYLADDRVKPERPKNAVEICFDPEPTPEIDPYIDHHPPENIPPDKDRIYSVNAGMYTPQSLVAFICEKGTRRVINSSHHMYSGKNPRYFLVKSVPAIVQDTGTDPYTGRLCQRASNDRPIWYAGRFDPAIQEVVCGPEGGADIGLKHRLRVFGNMMVAQGLMHEQFCNISRRYLFELLDPNSTEYRILAKKHTQPFTIDPKVIGIRWRNSDLETVVNNRDFKVALEIFGADDKKISSGFGSTLAVEVTISYEHKLFYQTGPKAGFLNSTTAFLLGDEVLTSKRTNDRIAQKRAVQGVAEFVLRIVGMEGNLIRLNATMFMPKGSWIRVPDNYSDHVCFKTVEPSDVQARWLAKPMPRMYIEGSSPIDAAMNENISFYEYDVDCKNQSPAVALSNWFNVTAQTCAGFKLHENYGITRYFVFNANFPIEGITYEILDSFGNRVIVGDDSLVVNINVTTRPLGINVHYDKESYLRNGFGTFRGSIIDVVDQVKLCFNVSSKFCPQLNVICTSRAFKITGNINIAVFGHLKHSGMISHPDPLIETFARFAVEDINDMLGKEMLKAYLPVFENRTLRIEGFDTKLDLYTATTKYKNMIIKGRRNPSKAVRCVIGFMSDVITRDIYPLSSRDKVSIIGVREQRSDIGELHFVRLCAVDKLFFEMLAQFFVDRGWTLINFLRSDSSDVSDAFYDIMKEKKIQIYSDIFLDELREHDWNDKVFSKELIEISKSKTKIIFNFVRAPLQYLVIRQAIRHGISCVHGYQWVSAGMPGVEFPTNNNHPICRVKGELSCTEGMAGTILIHETHQLDYSSDLWQHVHQKFFEMDRTLYRGVPRVYPYYFVSKYARGYDAVLMYALTVHNITKTNKTVKDDDVASKLANSKFPGLTGDVDLEDRERKNLVASLVTIQPGPAVDSNEIITAQICRNLSFGTYKGKRILVEVLQESVYETMREGFAFGKMTLPKSEFVQKRHFYSRLGVIGRNSQNLILPKNTSDTPCPIVKVLDSPSRRSRQAAYNDSFTMHLSLQRLKDPNTLVLRVETIVMSYYCENGCGGKVKDELYKHNYENGVCVALNECRCKTVKEILPDSPPKYWLNKAYSGASCDEAICERCLNGSCAGPEKCLCYKGYQGSDCSEAVCAGGCGVGECIAPNVCKCSGGLVGPHCSIILMVILGPVVILAIIFSCCCCNAYRNWRRRSEWRRVMTSTDWLVKWKDVTPFWKEQGQSSLSSTPISGRSSISGKLLLSSVSLPENTLRNLVMWRNQNCYMQRSYCESIDVSTVGVRMEIVELSHLKHPNIAPLVGVCLEYPHVGVLTEFFPKGSLEDVIVARRLPLDWDVKFSMLKDIARGMEYIHANYGSHGRLTTRSCLMDNRWTMRISSFGVPSLRNAPKRVEMEINPAKLLWTAPELLRKNDQSLSSGTKAGDVYSFSIIVSDVCSEDQPFALERNVLSVEEIIMLLKNIDDPANRGLRTTWIKFGGNPYEPIRPSIHRSQLPLDPRESNGVTHLMKQCWHESPGVRPGFKEMLSQLNVIKVVKGDLIDLLIRRLEEYSTNLEEKFVDTSKELQVEKDRLQDLLGRLLPKKIVEDMIFGKTVEAEQFEMVTVCFSDIADFISMTKMMSPYEVIHLLNSLYKCFDEIIDSFDVYKVETVRDEYMVVSGLPVRNGYMHASEIAMLALHLMSAMVDFVPHLTTFKGTLMLRIGIHTGPCVAGVVGLQMPRYCLFGDTINVASRMKSSSMALQIHMSDSTANILKIIGGFQFEYRGERDVKGRGRVKTYWLKGADYFDKPLPDITLAVPVDAQQFK